MVVPRLQQNHPATTGTVALIHLHPVVLLDVSDLHCCSCLHGLPLPWASTFAFSRFHDLTLLRPLLKLTVSLNSICRSRIACFCRLRTPYPLQMDGQQSLPQGTCTPSTSSCWLCPSGCLLTGHMLAYPTLKPCGTQEMLQLLLSTWQSSGALHPANP